jgi:IclR family acetate operon transcriptional repressor
MRRDEVDGTPRIGGSVQALDRAIDLLEHLAGADDGMSLSDLAQKSGLPQPTAHRLLRTLVHRGYVRQLPTRRYALGPSCMRLGERASHFLGAWTRPYLEQLVRAVGETANLAVLDGDLVVYVAQVPSGHSMRMFNEVGRRVYPHCTGVGKAILSQLPEHAVRDIVSRTGMPEQTPRTITDIDGLLAELAQTRQRGYAIDDGEQEVGVRCLAAPVPGAPTPAAVSISGPAARVTLSNAGVIVPLLGSTAVELGAELDGTFASRPITHLT